MSLMSIVKLGFAGLVNSRKHQNNRVKSASPDTEEYYIQCRINKDFSCDPRLKILPKIILKNKNK